MGILRDGISFGGLGGGFLFLWMGMEGWRYGVAE